MAIGRGVAWAPIGLLVGLMGCSDDADSRDTSGVTVVDSFPPASDDDGSTSNPHHPESDASDDDGSSGAPSESDSSTGTLPPVEFDPTFVLEQVDAALAAGVPGLAVAVVMQGEIVFADGFGVADESGTDVDATTLFNLASVSKSITAMTVLSLRDEGVLDLDAPVPTIAPQFAVMSGFDASSVRVEHLLLHTSAIGDWPIEPFVFPATLADSFASNANQPLWATPGTLWNYSNRGFELAGLVAAQASGQTFATAAYDRVLAPIGMTGATMDAAVASDRIHARGESSGTWLGPSDYLGEPYQPPGGLWASADDLAAMAKTFATREAEGFATSTLEEMTSAIQPTYEWPGAHYGYGLFVDAGADPMIVNHGGSTGGYLSDLIAVPEHGFGVVVVVNTDAWYPGNMSWSIMEHYDGAANYIAVDEPLDHASIAGTWHEPWHLGDLQIADGANGPEITFVDLGMTVPFEWLYGASYSCTHPTDGYDMGFAFWADANGQAEYMVGRDGVATRP